MSSNPSEAGVSAPAAHEQREPVPRRIRLQQAVRAVALAEASSLRAMVASLTPESLRKLVACGLLHSSLPSGAVEEVVTATNCGAAGAPASWERPC